MLNETLFALIFSNVDAEFDEVWSVVAFLGNVVAPLLAVAFGTVWLGGSGESASDEETETKERTAGAFRTFSEIVSAFVAARDAEKQRVEDDKRQEKDGAPESSASTNEFSNSYENAPNDATKSADSDELGALNPVDFWREDYWNFDFRLDRDDFNPDGDDSDDDFDSDETDASDERSNDSSSQSDRDSKSDAGPVRNDRDAREGLDPTPEETKGRRRAGNYFGAFFQNKKRAESTNGDANSNDVSSQEKNDDASDERKPRWKRSKGNDTAQNSLGADDDFNVENDASKDAQLDDSQNGDVSPNKEKTETKSVEAPKNDENDDSNGLGDWTRSIFDSKKSSETPFNDSDSDEKDDEDDESAELEFDYWNDDASWDDGPNEEYLDDESVSNDEKLDYLRRRIAAGEDDASREELARLLVQIAAEAGRGELKKALSALDEAEAIAAEAAENGDEERVEFLGQVLLQRPLFYLRNGLNPVLTTAAANEALAKIRAWAEYSSNSDARRLLATAWQTQGNALIAVGCEAAAVASLKTAIELFEAIVGEGATDAEPSLGYAAAALGNAYLAVGDRPRAIESLRKAIETFDKYASQEPFLAEKVNVLFRLAVALRQNDDAEAAERALQEAVDAEERLLSLDEENYIAPASQLLYVQADFYVRRGAFEDALVALDQAISALKRYLACDVALSNRVRGYLILESTLRKRASVCLWLERYSAAIRDVEEALEYLALATKKGENVEPIPQLVAFCGLIYDCGVSRGDWAFVLESQELLETTISRLTPDEKRQIAPLYAQLLLQRHVALAKAGRTAEALEATDRAVAALEERVDDGELDSRVLLAKALFQRGVYQDEVQENPAETRASFARAQRLYEEAKADAELDETSAALYLDLLSRKAFIETKENDFKAAFDDLQTGIVESFRLLRQNRWRYVDELENLSRTSVFWARGARDDEQALRIVRIWTRYWRRLRRLYVESSWNVERSTRQTVDDAALEESSVVQKTLEKIEGAVADLRRLRVDILETIDWEDEYSKYFDFSELDAEKRRAPQDAVRPEAEPNAANGSAEAIATVPLVSGALLSPTRRAVQICRDFLSLKRFKNVLKTTNEKNDSTETTPYAEPATLNSLKNFPLEAARSAFATETLANDSQNRALFADLLFCLRVVGRRVERGDLSLTKMFYQLLDKLTDVYLAENNLLLATAETLEATRRFESAAPWLRAKSAESAPIAKTSTSETPVFPGPIEPNDAPFFAEIFPFWELQTSFLTRLTTQQTSPSGGVPIGFDVDLTDATFRTTIEIARRSGATTSVENDADAESRSDPENESEKDEFSPNLDFFQSTAAKFRAFASVDVYFAWLAKNGRVDEGLALVRDEENRLKNSFGGDSRFDFLALGSFYYNFGEAAFAAELLDEAQTAFSRAETVFQEEEDKFGPDASLWERRGNARNKLGRLATFQGNEEKAAKKFRSALDDYRRNLETGTFDADVFFHFVKLSAFLLGANPFGAGNFAFERLRPLEEAAKNWSDEVRAETKIAFWRLKLAAAEFCVKRNSGARYRSFYTVKRLYQEANELLASLQLAEIPPRFVAEAKRQESKFWLRAGFVSQARAAFEASTRAWAAEVATAEEQAKKTNASDDAKSLTDDGVDANIGGAANDVFAVDADSEKDADAFFVPGDARRDVFIGKIFVASTFVQEGNLDEARRRFEPLLKTTRRVAERASQLLARGKKASSDEIFAAKNAAATVLGVERGVAELETELGRPDAARRRLRRTARATRKLFGQNSRSERYTDAYWAYAALKSKKYRLAIELTERIDQANESAPLDDENNQIVLWVAALRIQALAFLERKRRGDFDRAEKTLDKALRLLRDEFSQNNFGELRGWFAEILFVKARLEAEQGELEGAQKDASRSRRILATLVRRGQTHRQTLLRDEIEPFLLLTEARLAAKKAGTSETELVKIIQSGRADRLFEFIEKGRERNER